METRSNHILVGAVVLILLVGVIIAAFWFSRIADGKDALYDIYFKQSVSGLAKGSGVSFAGVPSGQVQSIELWKRDPSFVKVRISVKEETPILQGTTATIQGIGFTGVSEIQLDGAVKGAPPIVCPAVKPQTECPDGVPVIPTRPGALGELLSNAPQLLERLTTLTERLTLTLSDENQENIAGILKNTNRLSDSLADRGPEIAATIVETRLTLQKAGIAAEELGKLANTTNALLDNDGRPLVADLRKTVQSAQRSLETLDQTLSEARPGIQTLTKQTIPEAGLLIRDLRAMSKSFSAVAEKLDQQGAGSLVGSPALPDYKPR